MKVTKVTTDIFFSYPEIENALKKAKLLKINQKLLSATIVDKGISIRLTDNLGKVRKPKIKLEQGIDSTLESIGRLSPRIVNLFKRHKIFTLRDLTKKKETDFAGKRNFGPTTMKEINDFLSDVKCSFKKG